MPRKSLIDDWFAMHDDGEFVRHGRSAPYSVVSPLAGCSCVLFTTKPVAILEAIGIAGLPKEIALIGRYGLPASADIEWITDFVKRQRILFFGDLDPPDLLIFAWLREHMPPDQVRFLGVSDSLLRALAVQFSGTAEMELAPSEAKSLPIIETVLPDLVSVVGARCARSLKRGKKIELEAALAAAKRSRTSILRLIRSKA